MLPIPWSPQPLKIPLFTVFSSIFPCANAALAAAAANLTAAAAKLALANACETLAGRKTP